MAEIKDEDGKEVKEKNAFEKALDNRKQLYSQNFIGFCYMEGKFIKKNKNEGVRWFERAAGGNLPEAQFNLGLCYHIGEGVNQNYEKAGRLYRAAADQGLAQAMNNLALLHELGDGVIKSWFEAARWYRTAVIHGYVRTERNIRRVASGNHTLLNLIRPHSIKNNVALAYTSSASEFISKTNDYL